MLIDLKKLRNLLGRDNDSYQSGGGFAVSTTTAALGIKSNYQCTNTAAPRTLTIMDADVAAATPSLPWVFLVLDTSDGAATNNITIEREDTTVVAVINTDGGSIRIFVDGSNVLATT